MRALGVAVALLTVMATAAACGDRGENTVVATVDGQKIERREVESLVTLYHRRSEAELEKDTGEPDKVSHAQELATLQVLVQRAVVEQKAKQLGIHLDPQELEMRARELRGHEPDTNDRKRVKTDAEVEEQFRETARAQLLSQALYRRITRDVHVPDAEVLAYYRSHLSLYGGTGASKRPSGKVEQSIRRGLTAIARDQAMARWLKRVRQQFESRIVYTKGWKPPH